MATPERACRTDTREQSAQVESLQGAVYATRVVDTHYTLGVVGYVYDDYETTRALPANLIARGDYDGYQLGSYVESSFAP